MGNYLGGEIYYLLEIIVIIVFKILTQVQNDMHFLLLLVIIQSCFNQQRKQCIFLCKFSVYNFINFCVFKEFVELVEKIHKTL